MIPRAHVHRPRRRRAAILLDLVSTAAEVSAEIARDLVYDRLRQRLGVRHVEAVVFEMETRIAVLESKLAAREAERFPQRDAA